MTTLSRRRLLNLAGGAAAVGLAGCSGGGDDGEAAAETTRLGELAVTNFDADPHTVHAVFLEENDPVYWRSKRVPGAEEGTPQDVVFDGYPTDPENNVLHVRLDGQSRSAWQRFDFGEADVACLGLNVRIGDFAGDRDDELSLWTSGNPRECEDVSGESG